MRNLVAEVLNFIGGSLRWVFGTIWRSILKQKKFTFKEYILGLKSPNYYDRFGHSFNNIIIALIFFALIFSIL